MLKNLKKTQSFIAILTISFAMLSACAHKTNTSDCACMRAKGNCNMAEKQQCPYNSQGTQNKQQAEEQKSGPEKKCDDCRHADRSGM